MPFKPRPVRNVRRNAIRYRRHARDRGVFFRYERKSKKRKRFTLDYSSIEVAGEIRRIVSRATDNRRRTGRELICERSLWLSASLC